MLQLCDVHKRYSGIPAVEAVSFTAKAGEITGYLGANGSGKSTTMKIITGYLQADAGKITVCGHFRRRAWGIDFQPTPMVKLLPCET